MTVSGFQRPHARWAASRGLWLNAFCLGLCLAVSLSFTAVMFRHANAEVFARAVISAVVLPIVLAVPLLAYYSRQLARLWRLNGELELFAHKDALTQLWNRGAFIAKVGKHLAEMVDLSSTRGALMIVDADHFKSVNDRWGHQAGDDALRCIAVAMTTALHRDDVLGRLGGEEFGVFLYGSSPSAARGVAEKMRAAVEAVDLRSEDGEPIPLTISVGGVHFREALTFAALYQRADRNLYKAKANGRNRVEFENLGADGRENLAA